MAEGFLCGADVAVDGLRMESFTLENDIVLVIDPGEDLSRWLDFFPSFLDPEVELGMEPSRLLARLCRR